MIQLSSFKAVHYRGIDGLALPRLSRANLVTGMNGVGKTALIEAIWLFAGRFRPEILWNANLQRTVKPIINPVARLAENMLEIQGVNKLEENKQSSLKVKFVANPGGELPTFSEVAKGEKFMQLPIIGKLEIFMDEKEVSEKKQSIHPTPLNGLVLYNQPVCPNNLPSAGIESEMFEFETNDNYLQRYSSLVRDGRQKEVLDGLSFIEPKIISIGILVGTADTIYLSAELANKQLPLQDLGGGIIRLFRMLVNLITCEDGILVVDEIENGFHHSIQNKVWNRIKEWIDKWNVQFFATTHSAECINAAIEAYKDSPQDLSIHNLYRNNITGKIDAVTYSGETLEGARDLNLEMR